MDAMTDPSDPDHAVRWFLDIASASCPPPSLPAPLRAGRPHAIPLLPVSLVEAPPYKTVPGTPGIS
jgi:hypothetical protein